MGKFAVAAGLAIALATSATWAAESACDAGVSKALGKYVSCLCSMYSKAQKKGLPPDTLAESKCFEKFNGANGACGKAVAKGDCILFNGDPFAECSQRSADAANYAEYLCASSPSAAFLD